MFYEDEKLPGKAYVAIGIFDETEAFEPRGHSWFSLNLPWLDIRDGLPRHEESSKPR